MKRKKKTIVIGRKVVMAHVPLLPALWSGLNRLAEMDRLFEGWGEVPRPSVAAYPAVNVWESPEAFHVEAELPGVTQEDLQVFVRQRNRLTIQGERRAVSQAGSWRRRERGLGKFQRAVTLPAPVEAEQVEAKLENGLLHLTLPKAVEARPRKIEVKAG
jgi:HSP20 family protein